MSWPRASSTSRPSSRACARASPCRATTPSSARARCARSSEPRFSLISAQMRGEESHRALARDAGAVGVVARALVAIEALAGGVDVDLDALRVRRPHLLDVGQRNGVVLLAEMHQHRAARRLLRNRADAAAVIRHGGGEPGKARRRNPGEKSAPAIADHRGLAGLLDEVPRRRDVGERVLGRGLPLERDAFLDLVLAVAERDPGPDAVEQRRGDGQVAVCRETVGDPPDMAVDAEDLLDHDERALRRPRRPRHIGRRLEPARRAKSHRLAHWMPFFTRLSATVRPSATSEGLIWYSSYAATTSSFSDRLRASSRSRSALRPSPMTSLSLAYSPLSTLAFTICAMSSGRVTRKERLVGMACLPRSAAREVVPPDIARYHKLATEP